MHVRSSTSMGKCVRLQDALKQKMQQDASAFQQQLESINAQLKHKEAQLQSTVESLKRVQVDSEARIKQLSIDLQGAQDRVEALQAAAKAAADVHEV
jgi:DNA-binding protein YbaB